MDNVIINELARMVRSDLVAHFQNGARIVGHIATSNDKITNFCKDTAKNLKIELKARAENNSVAVVEMNVTAYSFRYLMGMADLARIAQSKFGTDEAQAVFVGMCESSGGYGAWFKAYHSWTKKASKEDIIEFMQGNRPEKVADLDMLKAKLESATAMQHYSAETPAFRDAVAGFPSTNAMLKVDLDALRAEIEAIEAK
jgi:hypothetical protein